MKHSAAIDGLYAWRRRVLDEFHPDWLPQAPEPLVQRARHSAIGRRWLARQLAGMELAGAAFRGFTLTEAAHAGAPPRAESDVLARWSLDLGTAAATVPLRAVVARQEVLAVRAVLGDARHRHMLQTPPPPLRPRAADEHQIPMALPLQPPAALRQSLQEQGRLELAAVLADAAPDLWRDALLLRLGRHTFERRHAAALDAAWARARVDRLRQEYRDASSSHRP